MKVGRNQPCLCGSGKKYKKCCLGNEKMSSDLLYTRLSEAHDRLAHRLMRFGLKEYGEEALGVALDEFMAWPDEGLSGEELADHEPLFYPWFIFNWEYEPDPNYPQLNGPEDTTIAELYAAQKADRLNRLEVQIIEATARRPFSFYEIQETRPGKGFRLKDILTGSISDVIEKKGSENARRGNILFGRVVRIDDLAMLIGYGTVVIPPRMKPELIRFRQCLQESTDPVTSRTLYDYDLEIRELYLNIYAALMGPRELQNTDGDPLSFHTIHYEIDSPGKVFEQLKELSVIDCEAEMRADAELDESGNIMWAQIPWSRTDQNLTTMIDNTVLGLLTIDDRRLKIEVNSARRAQTIRKEIKARLGKHARYITTEIQSLDAMLQAVHEREDEMPAPDPDRDELMQMPEVREHIAKKFQAHWENWVDSKIPALGYQTPRQAARDPGGRESVEALLLQARRNMEADEQLREAGMAAIAQTRRMLGLDKPAPAKAAKARTGEKARRVDEVKDLIESFGCSGLGQEYTGLALELCDKIGRMRKLSIQRGRTEIWAAAIIYVIARLNFLFDPESGIHFSADELCAFFGTKKSTVSSKAGLIQKTARIFIGDPDFSSPEIRDMFTLYETEEGLIVPGYFLDKLEPPGIPDETPPVPQSPPIAPKIKPRSKARKQKPVRAPAKEKADNRQLKLFDDE